jgi:hypothetical protein
MNAEKKARLISKLEATKYPLPECGALAKAAHEMWEEDGSNADDSHAPLYFGITGKRWNTLMLGSMFFMSPENLIKEVRKIRCR